MDILRVLSRGTKKSNRSLQGPVAVLPSAGAKTNPQLFNDEIRGTKRKRSRPDQANQDKTEHTELPEVDFFSLKDEAPIASKDTSKPAFSLKLKAARRLSEEECRQIIRSHRLKFKLVSVPEQLKVKDTKKERKERKKKKNEAAEDAKGKSVKKQLLYPQPLRSFAELVGTYDIPQQVSENLNLQGYRVPTEVQLGSLPLLLRPDRAFYDDERLHNDDVDFLAVAPTGSGKTISFLIPPITKIMRGRAQQGLPGSSKLEAVIVAPTRELAHQIVNEGRKILQGTGIKITGMRKGMRFAEDTQRHNEKAEESGEDSEGSESEPEAVEQRSRQKPVTWTDILVTTPMLLLNSLTGQPATLSHVRDLILDEADVLLDPLFRDQTMAIWTACTNERLRVSLWSATMGSNIEALVVDKLKSRAESLGIQTKPLVRLVVGLKDTAVPNITHKLVYTASEQGKLLALRQLLHPTAKDDSGPPLRSPFLVFTQTIERATALQEELKYDIPLEAGGSARLEALHAALPDSARAAIMRKFRSGDVWVLITTDVLARGVDFAGVNGVVNYDVPGSAAAYVHRAGRTGRAGREGGVAVTFYTNDDIPFVKTIANVIAASEKQAGKSGTDGATVPKWLLDALPNVGKAERKMMKQKGVESRRGGHGAQVTSKSGYDRQKDHNRTGAIQATKKRKMERRDGRTADGRRADGRRADDGEAEWDGFQD